MIEHAHHRRRSLCLVFLRLRLLVRVGTEQIVKDPPAWYVLCDDMGISQFSKDPPGPDNLAAGEAGRCGEADVGSRMRRQQAKQSRCRPAQILVRPRERRPDAACPFPYI